MAPTRVPSTPQFENIITLAEAAEIIGVAHVTVRGWLHENRFPDFPAPVQQLGKVSGYWKPAIVRWAKTAAPQLEASLRRSKALAR